MCSWLVDNLQQPDNFSIWLRMHYVTWINLYIVLPCGITHKGTSSSGYFLKIFAMWSFLTWNSCLLTIFWQFCKFYFWLFVNLNHFNCNFGSWNSPRDYVQGNEPQRPFFEKIFIAMVDTITATRATGAVAKFL